MSKTIIAGVSEWIFEFDNGDMAKLNTLIKEDGHLVKTGETFTEIKCWGKI